MEKNVDAQRKVCEKNQKTCGCKGIRSCRSCESSSNVGLGIGYKEDQILTVFNFCGRCLKAWYDCDSTNVAVSDFMIPSEASERKKLEGSVKRMEESDMDRLCDHQLQKSMDFDGILVLEDFVTEEEEASLCEAIYQTDFVNSQSGRRKQDFGPKVNFKKQKLRLANFSGLPSYSRMLYERIKQQDGLSDFEPVELCNLEYCSERGAHIDPHFDDAWLWGERLITLNLLSDSALTFTSDEWPRVEVRVSMPRRSLVVVQAAARHVWQHEIHREDIRNTRIAMTFREMSPEFKRGGAREIDGDELLKLALMFQGCAVGTS